MTGAVGAGPRAALPPMGSPGPASPADLTGHAPLHLDDVRRSGKAQAPEHAFAALEFIHLQDRPCFLEFSLGRFDVYCDLRHQKCNGSSVNKATQDSLRTHNAPPGAPPPTSLQL